MELIIIYISNPGQERCLRLCPLQRQVSGEEGSQAEAHDRRQRGGLYISIMTKYASERSLKHLSLIFLYFLCKCLIFTNTQYSLKHLSEGGITYGCQ